MENRVFANLPPFSCADIPLTDRRQKWITWKRGFEICLRASKINDATQKKDLLLAHGGFELQEIFFNIPGADVDAGKDTDTDPYKVALEKLDTYFAPQRHEAHERYVFWALKPESGESLTKFLMKTQTHASKCNFGKTSTDSSAIAVVDKMLQFVPVSLREKLLQVTNLDLEEVVKQVNAFETSRSASEQISGQSILPVVCKNPEFVQRVKGLCKFCGKNHVPGHCPAWNKTCSNCHKLGHFREVCYSRVGQSGNSASFLQKAPFKQTVKRNHFQAFQSNRTSSGKPPQQPPYPTRQVHAIGDEQEEEYTELVEMVSSASDSDELVWAKVGGVIVEMQIDSGVYSNIIDDTTWGMMLRNGVQTLTRNDQADKKLKAYAQKDCLIVMEMFDAEIIINDRDKELKTNARFYVVKDGPQPLLGKQTAKLLGVLITGLPSQHEQIRSIGTMCPFPKIRGVKIHIPIDKSVQPVVQRFRRLPFATLERVEDKLKELLTKDIIEKVDEPSRWVSPMVVVIKDSGEIRLCIDMRQVNKAVLRETHPLPTIEDVRWMLNGAVYFTRLDIKDAFHQLELDEESKPLTTFITHKGKIKISRKR
ncbi:uncharacterized protein LOC129718274 [Wyeomyia smithii]|uniref:uncharacterized protein LOC129718274 n=1 Tax=Wyeomyia smithii TaxID=174621 RepID=UPI002467E9F5|nr:uncharacterized protein LOC129718274 [Wyeomyia smithii]